MQSLQGKTAFITGAGKGLGKAMALALAKEGANLFLVGRTAADLDAVAQEAKTLNNDITVNTSVADVSDLTQVQNTVKELTAIDARIDILINNAGILRTGGILDLPIEEFEQSIKINVLGTYYVLHEVLPFLTQQSSSDIINIASTAGQKGNANLSAYGASKAAVINMSEAVMQEFRKKGVRVTTINPSTIATEMTLNAKFTDGNEERVLQPQDLAYLIVSHLKLPQRAFVKDFGLWSTNP
ncbi:3-ketoacyl-ACP reductase [Faecalibacter sp. WQ 117]|uniref:3-ketoacyl-ACP reductase n=2 Tax=Faecalibacter rhinopitheci TaxID=2779678 RepID=A0A8J7KAW4_9FLAO|nr:3-ketoacyl-ACP reductase [Faecalibacter rhinopitheci]MBQ0146827.1 3-ketoacyl-ACP reductase [Candidatus Onthonaster equi]